MDVSKSIGFEWNTSDLWIPSCLFCNITTWHMPSPSHKTMHMLKHVKTIKVSNIIVWTSQNRLVPFELQAISGYHLASFAISLHDTCHVLHTRQCLYQKCFRLCLNIIVTLMSPNQSVFNELRAIYGCHLVWFAISRHTTCHIICAR